MNLQSKFGYCMTTQTLNITLCKSERNYRQMEGRAVQFHVDTSLNDLKKINNE